MLLLEIAAHGVRGFSPEQGRVALRPGYNVVACDGAVLRRMIAALLLPDLPVDPALRADAARTRGAARMGMSFTGGDGVTWRLLRDLGGGVQLHRYDPGHRAMEFHSSDPALVSRLMRSAGAPSATRLSTLLTVAASDLPSSHARGRGAPPVPAGPGTPRMVSTGGTIALDGDLDAARLQDRLEGLQTRLLRVEALLAEGERLRQRADDARAGAALLAVAERALAALQDPEGRVEGAFRATARRDEAIARIAAERQDAEAERVERPVSLLRSPGFLVSAGVATLALLVGATSGPGALALLAIPAAGWAAFEGLRWVGRAEQSERNERREARLLDRERKAVEAWERDTRAVHAAMATAGLKDLAGLQELVLKVRESHALLSEAEELLREWQARPGTVDAVEERMRILVEIGELEGALTGGAEVREAVRPPVESGDDEGLPSLASDPFAHFGAGLPAPDDEPLPPPGAWGSASGDPLGKLLVAGASELQRDPGAGIETLAPRVQELTELLAGHPGSFDLDAQASVTVHVAGRGVPASALDPADLDLYFLVLKIAFLEQGMATPGSVGLVDDAFAGLSLGRRRALARVFRGMAHGRQIVHGTRDESFREAADHAA